MSQEISLSQRSIFATWWPLAASWELMAMELPLVSAVIARLADPALNLAAYGGVVFPIALLVESPIIMLLAASTALSRDFPTFVRVRGYMRVAGAALTALHVLVAFTPLFDLVVEHVLGTPEAIREPARLGLQIMTPWTWSIAYRRFHQGVLIRFGHARAVGLGTVVRLCSNAVVLAIGYTASLPGIVVATLGVVAGVMGEALYTGWRVRCVVAELRQREASGDPIALRAFVRFYVPLALTPLMMLGMEPVAAAAMGRMPAALLCLAAWPVVFGLVWMVEALGEGYQEVVVALIDRPGGYRALRLFAARLLLVVVAPLVFVAAVPAVGRAWFEGVTGLSPELARLAGVAVWFAVPMPAVAVLRSLFHGVLLHHQRTRAISEAMALFLATAGGLCALGVVAGDITGLFVAVPAMSIGMAVQTSWLALRTHRLRAAMV